MDFDTGSSDTFVVLVDSPGSLLAPKVFDSELMLEELLVVGATLAGVGGVLVVVAPGVEKLTGKGVVPSILAVGDGCSAVVVMAVTMNTCVGSTMEESVEEGRDEDMPGEEL